MPPSRPPKRTGDPNVAALLTWFIPGAGHLYIGKALTGVLGFAVVWGLYWLGLELSDGMGFEFLNKELRGPLAPALAPELGNLSGLLWQSRTYGFGPGFPRVFPDTVYIGTLCTACSGILNLFLMVKANSDARGLEEPGLGQLPVSGACLFGWLVPGGGHLVQGRRTRALIIFVMLTGLLILGTWLAEASNLDRERHFYYWGGQLMGGLPAIGLERLWGHPEVKGEIKYAEAGLVLASLAGLLNILAILDVYSWGEERALEGMSEDSSPRRSATAKEASA
ncbi:MAG: hypothetical protein MK291_00825 [Planctomycetes bacterium]|nr:hypothetical protein [Planctomycetota bacterium]